MHDLARWVVGLDRNLVLSAEDLAAAWTPVRLNDGGTYPYGFGWMLGELRGQPRIGHTGAWQGFRTSIQRFPSAGLTVIVLANLEQARPEAISLAVAGMLEPSLVPPHRLTSPLPGPGPPAAVETLLRRLADGTEGEAATPGLRRFLADPERTELRELVSDMPQWTPLGCDRPADHRFPRLGSEVAHVCYARGQGSEGDLVVTVSYTADWQAADVESYRF